MVVTGAGGFIGSHLVEHLVRAGHRVRALVRYTSHGGAGQLDSLPADVRAAVEIVRGDVRDTEQMDTLVGDSDAVLHLAALIGIPYSYEAPRSYLDVNAAGTLNILEAARRHETPRVVVTSTSEVYGTAQRVPIDEDHPLHPQSPYAASKVAADQLALSYQRSFGTPVVLVRPFNTYGPRQSLRAVIPTIVAQLTAREDATVELGALSPKRDFVFVNDTAAGMLALATADETTVCGGTFNLATGESVSIEETARLIAELVGKPQAKLVSTAERVRPDASEVEVLEGTAARMTAATGWTPQVKLRDGLRQVIDWYRNDVAVARAARDIRDYHV